MQHNGTLLLRRSDVAQLLSLEQCIEAVEAIFRRRGEGQVPASGILGIRVPGGGLHVKAGYLPNDPGYIVAKLNTNFRNNPEQFDLPTIQGLIVLYHAGNGRPLAVVDSTDITIKRTAAASAVAAKYLARPESSVITVCGCGRQGRAQLQAMASMFSLRRVNLFDLDQDKVRDLASTFGRRSEIEIESKLDPGRAIRESDLCVTCTPADRFYVRQKDVAPGTFIAAVGADAEDKQEIDPALIASSKVVVDDLEQCSSIGDLHHAISQGLISPEKVYAELAEIVAGRKPGRTSAEEVIIFDSTGIALEDAAAVTTVYEKARAAGEANYLDFAA